MNIEITETHKKDAEALIRGVRLGMINSSNKELKLFGIVSTQLKIEIVDYIPTCATDGQKLMVNPLFVLGLTKYELGMCVNKMKNNPFHSVKSEEDFKLMYSKKSVKFLEFCIVHELSHCLHDHFTRAGTRDRSIYNKAADYRINADACTQLWGSLDKAIKQESIFKLLCLDNKYKPKHFTSEIIYDELVKDQEKNKQISNNNTDADGYGGSGQQGQTLDDHIYNDGSGSGKPSDLEKFIKDVLGLPDKPTNHNGQDKGDVQSSVQMNNNRIKEAFVQTAKDIGHGSGGLIEQIKEMSKPVISWKRILRKSLSGLNKSEYDPKKLHRRVHGLSLFMKQNKMLDPKLGMYRAGKKPEPTVNVVALFDTSGSISQKEKEIMLSETFGVCQQYSSFNLTVACWGSYFIDKSIKTFNKKNKNELKDYKFHAGGGTDINCVVDFLETQKLKSSDRVIIFTDCYFGDPREKLTKYSKQLIFVSTQKNMNHATRSLGKYIEYDKHM